ncbi:hypothetical protein F5141DRAFT_1147167 [Pisolithus sp. B1]|nr:hypothetical protein F5141DRAFT_1147167 [Pisolithus sp. B1]
MPVPAAPRRAAPPRKKTFKSAPSTPLPEVPVSASGSEEPDSEPVVATSPPPSSTSPLSVTEASKVEASQQLAVTPPIESLTGEGHHEIKIVNKPADVPDDSLVSGEGSAGVVLMERPETIVNEPEGYVEEEGHTQELEAEGQGYLKGSSASMTADDEHGYVPSVQEFSSHVHVEAEPEEEKELGAEQEQDEGEQDDEARRKRVAARLAQMGAFNPLAGPTPIPRRTSIEEPHSKEGQFDVEDEANVDTEEVGECVLSPPTATTPPGAHHVDEEFEHGHVSVEVEERNLDADVERDVSDEHEAEFESTPTAGNWITHRVLYHNTGVDDDDEEGQQRISSPSLGHEAAQPYLEGRPAQVPATDQDSSDVYSNRDDLGEPRASATEAELDAEGQVPDNLTDINASRSVSFTRPDNQSALETSVIDDHGRFSATEKEEDDNMAPPRITRPIPPPPVNFGSKPPLVPFSASSRTAVPSLKDEDEDRAVSPDIPPRPIPPPPVRSVPDAVQEELPVRPRHSIPPPPRRSSLRVTEPIETPPTPPPVPTLPRPTRRPTSPPILTALPTLQVSERAGSSEELEVSASKTQEPQGQETEDDDEAARRRTIAERMARLGGIRFGVPAPMHHLSRAPMPPVPPPTSIPPDDSEAEGKEDDVQPHEEEDEAARKERIRAKIAEIGGIRFGERPPTVALPAASARRLVSRQEDSESEDTELPVPVPPPQRASSIRRPPPSSVAEPEQSSLRMPEGVKLEAERSGAEEMQYSDADVLSGEEEGIPPPLPPARRKATTSAPIDALPTPPPRSSPIRLPIAGVPASLLNRRASTRTGSVPSSRKSSTDYTINADTPIASSPTRTSQEPVSSEISFRPQSEYVMVEAELGGEETPVPPPRRPTRVPPPPRSIPLPPPPPPSAIDPPEELASSNQWELPSIPQGAEFIADSDLASSGWSDDSTAVHFQPPPPPPQAPILSVPTSCGPTKQTAHSGSRSTSTVDQHLILSAEELMTVWGKIGVRVVEAASGLFEKSKRSLVGDGSYPGFVRAALAQVPEALRTSDPEEWGYVIYAQTGATVQRRVVDIMPGDVISFWDATLKGHKNLHAYSQTVGMGQSGALVGIVHEFEAKKSKVRVWQANQHVGQQSVEIVSYRLEDLKSGNVKVFRVLENAT